MPSFDRGRRWGGGGGGVRFYMGVLRERPVENNKVLYMLYFYSSPKITKYFAFCIFIVVQLRSSSKSNSKSHSNFNSKSNSKSNSNSNPNSMIRDFLFLERNLFSTFGSVFLFNYQVSVTCSLFEDRVCLEYTQGQ